MNSAIEEEQRARDEAREAYKNAERRNAQLSADLEEARAAIDAAERARKAAESEFGAPTRRGAAKGDRKVVVLQDQNRPTTD